MTNVDDRLARAMTCVAATMARYPLPGAVVGVLDLGTGARAVAALGHARIVPHSEAMRRDTVFDLASLTKPVFTATQLLRLVEQGRTTLDTQLCEIIPDLRQYNVADAWERRLTLRQCLTHQTKLPAVAPIYTLGADPARLRAYVLQHEWCPGAPCYSDIGYILLGIALERLHDAPLDALDPGFGLGFHPDPAACAATEHCRWRDRILCGEVHDENAAALGLAGHAGLFGTADGLLDYARALMQGELLGPDSLAAMRARTPNNRTIGWEAQTPGWLGGAACSDTTIGHTGFTGTGLWLDFDRGLVWTLLTNRVHPSRHVETGIGALRRAVGEAVCR